MDITTIKKDFAIFEHESDLVYLDSTATSLTPKTVIAKMDEYYAHYNANTARGVYHLSERATQEFEDVRDQIATFIGAQSRDEVIFTSGTTMSINLVAHGLSHQLKQSSEITVTAMEHHANFVPWQELVSSDRFHVITLAEDYKIDTEDLTKKINTNTAIFALSYVSNVLGTINPVKKLIAKAKKINPNIITIVDAAQASPHIMLDVIDIGCDFLAFSAHKMCGPTGVGVLWGKKEKLEDLKPFFTGGEMIGEVTSRHTTFAPLPHRLEAGTQNIAGVIGLGEAIRYLEDYGLATILTHEHRLTQYALEQFHKNFDNAITIYGPQGVDARAGVISFRFGDYHPHDVASILDSEKNVCVRAGNHCAMPLHIETLGILATARASFYLYNDTSDIDKLIDGLKKVVTILK